MWNAIKSRITAPILIILVTMGVAGAVGIFVAVQAAHEAGRGAKCASNLKQLGIAFHNYHDAKGNFPPAYVADNEGRPMHSWRVLILPYISEEALYKRYKFDEPWDSPDNLRVAEQMPEIFRCPSENGPTGSPDFMVITGPETLFDGEKPGRLEQVSDGASDTLLLVEVNGASTLWTQPVDIELSQSALQVVGGPPGDFGSNHRMGVRVLMADASERLLTKDDSPKRVRAMATKSGQD